MKIITICGSLRFEQDIKIWAEKLELEGNCVLSIIYSTKNKDDYTHNEVNLLQIGHLKRIELSDAIFVVNKNGYIGNAVRNEIEHAKKHNKEITYLEPIPEKENIKYFNKLVRDKIIGIIERNGGKTRYEELDIQKFSEELDKKLIEEVIEYIKENTIEELADIFEVLYAIIEHKNLDINEIEKTRLNKKEERGGFNNKIFLKNVNI